MNRILAIIERDMRKFMRSPTLIVVSMFLPLVQLVVLGYAFGGKIKELRVGIVDQDRGIPTVKLREMFGAIAANARTFTTVDYTDLTKANTDLREGRINAVLNIPPEFSRRFLAQDAPQVALIEDNTDNFAVGAPGRSILRSGRRLQSARPQPTRAQWSHAFRGGALPLRSLHPIPAFRLDCYCDLYFGDDRRRHHLY